MLLPKTALTLMALTLFGAGPVFAEAKELPRTAPPLLKVETYDTQYGQASRSFIWGYPVRGDIVLTTDGDRDTRKEGFEHDRNKSN